MYKIIYNGNVVDVVESPKFVRFLSFGHIALTNKGAAQGIVGSDGKTVYSFSAKYSANHAVVSAVEIPVEEFKRLKDLLNSNEPANIESFALSKAKRDKIAALSGVCKYKITEGFKIRLSDGQECSFRLTPEDQLNLICIESQLAAGESMFVYHATNQPCRLYNKADMRRIVKAFRKHVLYHTTYFNIAKQYINTLTDIENVDLFEYGFDVTDIVTEPTLRQILKNGGA